MAKIYDIQKTEREKCIVIPNGIDDYWVNNIYLKERILSHPIKIITAGRIEKNKNQLTVAKAVERMIASKNYKMIYEIVGDVKSNKLYKQLCNYSFVEFKPFLKKENLITEFRKADIYVMASHTETFGLVYAEAMTQGMPVVYSKGQGFDEQFEDGVVGFSVDSTDFHDIVRGIENTIEHFFEISTNAIKLCKKFDWSIVVSNLVKIYEQTILKNE